MPPLDPQARRLIALVLSRAGLSPAAYREGPLQRRLAACLRALEVRTPEQAVALLERRPRLLDRALDSLLLGVTAPFRDPPLFEALRQVALPGLLARRGARDPLRVWSVGCSDGCELYSVAMVLADLAGSGGLEAAELLGTDCRPGAIRRARAGRFADLEGVPEAVAARYLERDGAGWRVVPRIRRRTRFEVADILASTPEPATGGFDLILCRNLAIYLAPPAVARLWERLLGALVPGGYLAVGKAGRIHDHRLRSAAPLLYRHRVRAREGARR